MDRNGPVPFLVSIGLHLVVLALLLYVGVTTASKRVSISSVPVDIVSSVPSHELAEAPVDELAVKTPVPEPAPDETPVPTPPEPVPAPKLPVPVPQKAVTPPTPKPTPKPPAPAKVTPAPPDKNGQKKPTPAKPTKPALDLDALSQLAASPSKAPTRKQAQANTHATNGASNFGSAPAETGPEMKALVAKLQKLWSPNCDVPGGNQVQVDIKFTLSPNGRVITGPVWVNQRGDTVWVAGANRAMAAVKRGELYDDLPNGFYNTPITITFDAKVACRNQ